jgi:hypothetical protein
MTAPLATDITTAPALDAQVLLLDLLRHVVTFDIMGRAIQGAVPSARSTTAA